MICRYNLSDRCSDVLTILDVASLYERITVREAAQTNVVVFDLGIKRGDF